MSGAVELGPWEREGPGIRSRVGYAAGCRFALVEYGPGSRRNEWCEDGHRGYVVDGSLEYELADGTTLALKAGQPFVLVPGLGHRGRNSGDAPATVFLMDDPVGG